MPSNKPYLSTIIIFLAVDLILTVNGYKRVNAITMQNTHALPPPAIDDAPIIEQKIAQSILHNTNSDKRVHTFVTQCNGITRKGNQCKRMVSGWYYCYQHTK